LSDTPYYRRGVNLLAKTVSSPWYFGYNEDVVITEKGAFSPASPEVFFSWQDQIGLLVKQEPFVDRTQRLELERLSSYKSLMSWQLNRQINHQP
jgi:hypothetical protein